MGSVLRTWQLLFAIIAIANAIQKEESNPGNVPVLTEEELLFPTQVDAKTLQKQEKEEPKPENVPVLTEEELSLPAQVDAKTLQAQDKEEPKPGNAPVVTEEDLLFPTQVDAKTLQQHETKQLSEAMRNPNSPLKFASAEEEKMFRDYQKYFDENCDAAKKRYIKTHQAKMPCFKARVMMVLRGDWEYDASLIPVPDFFTADELNFTAGTNEDDSPLNAYRTHLKKIHGRRVQISMSKRPNIGRLAQNLKVNTSIIRKNLIAYYNRYGLRRVARSSPYYEAPSPQVFVETMTPILNACSEIRIIYKIAHNAMEKRLYLVEDQREMLNFIVNRVRFLEDVLKLNFKLILELGGVMRRIKIAASRGAWEDAKRNGGILEKSAIGLFEAGVGIGSIFPAIAVFGYDIMEHTGVFGFIIMVVFACLSPASIAVGAVVGAFGFIPGGVWAFLKFFQIIGRVGVAIGDSLFRH